MESLKFREIANEFFKISFEAISGSCGTIIFQKIKGGQMYKGRLIVLNVALEGRTDVLIMLLRNQVHVRHQQTVCYTNYLTCKVEHFEEVMNQVIGIT